MTTASTIHIRCERVCFGEHTNSQSAVTSGHSSSDPLTRCEVDASTTCARTSPGLTWSPHPFDPHGSGSRGTPGTDRAGVFSLPPQEPHSPGGFGFRPPGNADTITEAHLRAPTRTQPTAVDHPRTGGSTPRRLPSPSDDDAWTAELVFDIAQVPPCGSPEELIDTYGTADPAELRARFALADDVEAAERFAAEGRQVAA